MILIQRTVFGAGRPRDAPGNTCTRIRHAAPGSPHLYWEPMGVSKPLCAINHDVYGSGCILYCHVHAREPPWKKSQHSAVSGREGYQWSETFREWKYYHVE